MGRGLTARHQTAGLPNFERSRFRRLHFTPLANFHCHTASPTNPLRFRLISHLVVTVTIPAVSDIEEALCHPPLLFANLLRFPAFRHSRHSRHFKTHRVPGRLVRHKLAACALAPLRAPPLPDRP